MAGAMCTKQRGMIKVWACACQKSCDAVMGCHLGYLKHDIQHNLINTEEEFVFYAFNVLQRQNELCCRRANVSDSCRPLSTSSQGATPLTEGAFSAGMVLKVRVFAMAATGCGRQCDSGWGLVTMDGVW